MSDRAQTRHTDKTGPQEYDTDAAYTLEQKEMQIILSRIKGLFPPEMCAWVEVLPEDNRVIKALGKRYTEMHMNNAEARNWAQSLTLANSRVFEHFVDKEESAQVLTMMLEAEASRTHPREDRIAYINKRKQDL